jgi:hypothetical protein
MSLGPSTLKFVVGDFARCRTHDRHADATICPPISFDHAHQGGRMVLIYRTKFVHVSGNRIDLRHIPLEVLSTGVSSFLQSAGLHLINKPDLIPAVEKSDAKTISTGGQAQSHSTDFFRWVFRRSMRTIAVGMLPSLDNCTPSSLWAI